ncbi:MAG: FAD-dependent oxidoreductase [Clostridia bacterium]|nr:FAD-dependent oxidoreductase [Clostridia bacterium]
MKKRIKFGGMAKCISYNGTKIEKHYRHIFKSDKYVIELLKEFDLLDEMLWNKTKMAYYSKDGLYEFGTPTSLLKYKPLSFIEKIRFGFSVIKIKLINDYKKIERYTAEQWVIKNCGENVYKKTWEPLLFSKFGNNKDKISMAWLWGKIKLRGSSSEADGERLGYLNGSYERLTQKIEKYLLKNNCKIKTSEEVKSVSKDGRKYVVETSNESKEFDYVVSTVSYDISKKILKDVLSSEEINKMNNLKYTCAKTLLIFSKKSFSPFYWINIGCDYIPFGGIIEHTNMIDCNEYGGAHLIYVSNYMDKNDRLYALDEKQLFEEYNKYLKEIGNGFDDGDIIELKCFEEDCAQPVITTNYSHNILDIQMKENGIFMANMAQIYPEDRGMNYAIKMGYEVAANIIMNERLD